MSQAPRVRIAPSGFKESLSAPTIQLTHTTFLFVLALGQLVTDTLSDRC